MDVVDELFIDDSDSSEKNDKQKHHIEHNIGFFLIIPHCFLQFRVKPLEMELRCCRGLCYFYYNAIEFQMTDIQVPLEFNDHPLSTPS